MKPKDRMVIFTKQGARIIKDPALIALHKDNPNALLNPEIPPGSPSHFILENGIIKVDKAVHESKSNIQQDPNLEYIEALKKQINNLERQRIAFMLIAIISGVINVLS